MRKESESRGGEEDKRKKTRGRSFICFVLFWGGEREREIG
jgi:hypothetical protein